MTVAANTIRKHEQEIACPNCRFHNYITPKIEQQTERGYYIKTDGSNFDCRVCARPFNFQLELKVEKVGKC